MLMTDRQEDALEFFSNLILSMQDCCNESSNSAEVLQQNQQSNKSDSSADEGDIDTSSFSESTERKESDALISTAPTNSNGSTSAATSASTAAATSTTTYPQRLFSGLLSSRVYCAACCNVSATAEPIQGLELEIGRAATLHTALAEYCRSELLEAASDNAYACEVCAALTSAQKCLRLQEVPDILRIQVRKHFGRK